MAFLQRQGNITDAKAIHDGAGGSEEIALENEKEAGQVFPPPFFPLRGIRLT